jgi:hypothetical protein
MKKNYLLLLLLLLISVFKISAQGVGSISIVSIPASTAAGTNASIQITYVSDVNCSLSASIRQTNANLTSVNWSNFYNQLVTTNLPTTAGSPVTLSYPILAGQAPSASLPAGVQYTYAFKLTKTGGTDFAYNDGMAANITSVTAAAVTNTVTITSAPTTVVAGGSVLVNFNYTLINAGKVKVEVRKFDGTTYISGAAGLVVDTYIDPAAATTTTPVTASKTLLIPSGTIPSTGLTGAENYKVVVTIYTSAFGYIADKKSNITVTANHPSWNGATSGVWTDATNWSTGIVPNQNSNVTIAALGTQPTIISNVTINSLNIAAGATLAVTGPNLTITGAIANSGTMTLANNSNLIQGGTTNTNTGNITVNRNSNALKRLDYTLWSSPVTGTQTLAQFSPLTSQSPYNRFFTYDPASNLFINVTPAVPFSTGTGYLIRMPNEDPANLGTSSNYFVGTDPLTYNGVFTGIPNNGTVTLGSITPLTSDKYYSVGNPYPSTISAAAFLGANATDGTLYFWRKTNAAANSTGSAYATWTTFGAAASNVAPNDIVPNGTIQVGQGFIVKTGVSATTLSFTNAMRLGTTSTQFFKTKQLAEKSRVWLNLINTAGAFSQALVGYVDGATTGVDNGIDGKYINDSAIALTSNINNEEYTIQGRPAFDASDVVALNFKTDTAGDYTIAIDHVDGLFATGQDIYLADSKTGAETNLKDGAYNFTATAGVDNARFSLKYQKTLKLADSTLNNNTVIVFKNKGTLYVNSSAKAINSIKVYDVQGRLIAEQKNVKANTATISNLKATNQILIVQVRSEDNSEVTKKVAN